LPIRTIRKRAAALRHFAPLTEDRYAQIRGTRGEVSSIRASSDNQAGSYAVFISNRGSLLSDTPGDDVIDGRYLVVAGLGNDTFNGGGDPDFQNGAHDSDVLDGGPGADTMDGKVGDDLYINVDAGDLVIEAANAGIDTIWTREARFTLPGNVENLVYTGPTNTLFTGTGNAGANSIAGGNAGDLLQGLGGNDLFEGRGGADSMHGGPGDDIYFDVDPGDILVELAGEGTDSAWTRLSSYALPDNVENLTFIGTGSFQGTGNGLANTITGGGGGDQAFGGAGNDTLLGAGGDDYLHSGLDDDLVAGGDGNEEPATTSSPATKATTSSSRARAATTCRVAPATTSSSSTGRSSRARSSTSPRAPVPPGMT
jgi:Ca2+-binding RTX toxin-like protein